MGKGIKKRKMSKRMIAIALLLIFSVIIVIGVYQNSLLPRSQKKLAAEYFQITQSTPGNVQLINNGTALMIYEVYIYIKAVGGDAHAVKVKSSGMLEPGYIQEIKWNETKYAYLYSQTGPPFGYISYRDADGLYPFSFEIDCLEAKGPMITYF